SEFPWPLTTIAPLDPGDCFGGAGDYCGVVARAKVEGEGPGLGMHADLVVATAGLDHDARDGLLVEYSSLGIAELVDHEGESAELIERHEVASVVAGDHISWPPTRSTVKDRARRCSSTSRPSFCQRGRPAVPLRLPRHDVTLFLNKQGIDEFPRTIWGDCQ